MRWKNAKPQNSFKQNSLKQNSLKRKILAFLILCWGVPIAIFSTFATVSYRKGIVEKTENLMEDELQNVAAFASIRIEDAIALCQRPSYERTWEDAWKNYRSDKYTKSEYLQSVNSSLKGKFYLDERFCLYAYYCYGQDNPACFSSRVGYSYEDYTKQIQPYLEDIIESGTSYACVRVVDGRIFIIRNLYTTVNYEQYGTLIVEMDKDKVFQDVNEKVKRRMLICFNEGDGILDFSEGEVSDAKPVIQGLLTEYDGVSNRKISKVSTRIYNGYLYQEKQEAYHIGVIILEKKSELYQSLYQFYGIIALMLLLFVPLVVYCVYFLKRNIQHPIDQMMRASKRMEQGEIGVEVEGSKMPNSEFQYMRDSFNSMSAQVKYLFDSVYNEKLARKDAQIQALQAQINPHFLNNTLEMMNWQARMSGNTIVSKMIESLGTVLDYCMNRASVNQIHLAEELQCIDAYFYIMSMRFGQRLQIEKTIDEEMLGIMVPPLILQPLVENAIVHGVERVKNGKIRLSVWHDERNAYLEVRNTGKELTREAWERIQAMLGDDENKLPKGTGRHTSIGIRNVNRRIRLVYGEEYGLTIVQDDNLEIVSTITIPYHMRKDGFEEALPGTQEAPSHGTDES